MGFVTHSFRKKTDFLQSVMEIPKTRYSLIGRAQGNDDDSREALNELCRIYAPIMQEWARQKCAGQALDFEELAQISWVRFLEKSLQKTEFNPDVPLRATLRTIIRYVKLELLRSQDRFRQAESRLFREVLAIDAEDELVERFHAATVQDIVEAFEAYRESLIKSGGKLTTSQSFEMVHLEERSIEDTAKALGLSTGAVRVNCARVRSQINRMLLGKENAS